MRPEFRDLLMRIAGDRGGVSTRRLARWLRRSEGRIVDGLKLGSLPITSAVRFRRLLEHDLSENRKPPFRDHVLASQFRA